MVRIGLQFIGAAFIWAMFRFMLAVAIVLWLMYAIGHAVTFDIVAPACPQYAGQITVVCVAP